MKNITKALVLSIPAIAVVAFYVILKQSQFDVEMKLADLRFRKTYLQTEQDIDSMNPSFNLHEIHKIDKKINKLEKELQSQSQKVREFQKSLESNLSNKTLIEKALKKQERKTTHVARDAVGVGLLSLLGYGLYAKRELLRNKAHEVIRILKNDSISEEDEDFESDETRQ